jgi:energy-coupling factor transport system substrate-specific component
MFNFSVKHLVATAIGAAIFFLLARFLSFPVFANTFLSLQYAVLGFFAAVFGPIAGLLIGLIGHFLTDLTFGWGLWWSWIITSAVVGFASGFILKPGSVEEGEFGVKEAVRFIIGSLVVHAVSWGLIAPVLDILIYAEPANKVFTQGIISGTGNFVLTAVVGTALIFGYSKTRTKSGSLE